MSSKKNYSKVKFVKVKVSAELQVINMEMMLGFSKEMQLEIADNLLDFAHGHVVHTTGCWSADAVLKSCYEWIAEEQGFRLNL